MPNGNWLDASLDDQTLAVILQLAYEFLDLTGRRISLAELRAALRGH